MKESKATLLAGDIGGTKTNLALYLTADGPQSPALFEKKYRNLNYQSLEEIIGLFLAKKSLQPDSACFGIAGPVLDGKVSMTNLDWVIDSQVLKTEFDFTRVDLINDLVATALGTTVLKDEEVLTINTGRKQLQGNVAVIAPGTGLGEAFLTGGESGGKAHASEGGHASFAPRNDHQIALWRYMHAQYDHISTEQVCSGRALPGLYEFLKAGGAYEFEWLDKELAKASSPVPGIISAALEFSASGKSRYELAGATVQLFIDILAGEAANLSLKVLSTGGLFIGGGIAPRISTLFDAAYFMNIFSQGVYADMLSAIPVHIILNPKTALLGAAVHAFESLQEH